MRPIVTDVAWSVRLSVCHDRKPCKNSWADQDAIWVGDSDGSKEPCVRWGADCPWKGAIYIDHYAFSALTLLVWQQEGHPACKNWVLRYWHGYLSDARCKWVAYGPANATAIPSSLALVKSRIVYLSAAGLCTLFWKKSPLNGCSSSSSSSSSSTLTTCSVLIWILL